MLLLFTFLALSFSAMADNELEEEFFSNFSDANCSFINQKSSEFIFSTVQYCAFPYQKLHSECVVQSCPTLSTSGLCPLKDNSFIDQTAIKPGLALMTECLRVSDSVCGVPTQDYEVPYIQFMDGRNFYNFLNSRIIMPWLRNDFVIEYNNDFMETFIIYIDSTLLHQLHVSSKYYSYDEPNGKRFRKNRAYSDEYKLFSREDVANPTQGLTTFSNNVSVNVSLETSYYVDLNLTSLPTSRPNVDIFQHLESKSTAQVAYFQEPSWNNMDPYKANLRMTNAMISLVELSKNMENMALFISTYLWYGFMEMDRICKNNKT